MASRAQLLAGLRTGGPRSSSPFEGDRFEQEQNSPRPNNASPAATTALKANAAPFTPSKRLSGMDGQNASALRMQQQAIAAANAQRQAGEDFAAMYGASQGQPHDVDYQQQDIGSLIRQKQAQLLQNQLLAQQQQQQHQQMEMYRLQAASQQQQQQHLQQVAAQQRVLLAQMQAEYSQQQYSAQDQRMSAQLMLQASMRQRQAEQMYGDDAQVQQQQQLLQHLQLLQMQAAAMQGMQDMSFGEDSPQAMSTPIRRNGTPRADSPSIAQQNRRDRQASQTAADNATSWRSTPTSLSKATAAKANAGRQTPSIVVDDSASEKSETEASLCEDNETPETSEEDISAGVNALAKDVGQRLSVEKRSPSTSPHPRPLALSQAPRNRAFSADVKTNVAANAAGVNVASRQPRGPPTEFLSINFTSRLSVRTRREAMSKLCASPRAASFNLVSRSAVVA